MGWLYGMVGWDMYVGVVCMVCFGEDVLEGMVRWDGGKGRLDGMVSWNGWKRCRVGWDVLREWLNGMFRKNVWKMRCGGGGGVVG